MLGLRSDVAWTVRTLATAGAVRPVRRRESEALVLFFATFQRRQPLASCYVAVEAQDEMSADEVLTLMYQDRWLRLHRTRQEVEHLTEVPFGTLNCEVS